MITALWLLLYCAGLASNILLMTAKSLSGKSISFSAHGEQVVRGLH